MAVEIGRHNGDWETQQLPYIKYLPGVELVIARKCQSLMNAADNDNFHQNISMVIVDLYESNAF